MSYQTILSRSVTKAEKKDPSVSGILHPAWFVGSWKSQFSVLLKVLWHGKVQGGSFKTQAQIPEARFCHPYRSPGYWKLGQQSLWPLQPSRKQNSPAFTAGHSSTFICKAKGHRPPWVLLPESFKGREHFENNFWPFHNFEVSSRKLISNFHLTSQQTTISTYRKPFLMHMQIYKALVVDQDTENWIMGFWVRIPLCHVI